LIVEIKAEQYRAVVESEIAAGRAVSREGRKALALRRWENLNPDHLKYQMIYTAASTVPVDRVRESLRLLGEEW
jgi:type III restriction enzyme